MLDLIIGNMFSGKSTELIRRINTLKSINKKVLVINYLFDNRYSNDNKIATHDHTFVDSIKTDSLSSLMELIHNYDSIFIDEGQFFNDLFKFVSICVDKYNKHITVSGLDGDSNRQKFGSILDLIPICDNIIKLKAYCIKCSDGTYGPFTKKIINNSENIPEINQVIDIGGSDKYIAVCRLHYLN